MSKHILWAKFTSIFTLWTEWASSSDLQSCGHPFHWRQYHVAKSEFDSKYLLGPRLKGNYLFLVIVTNFVLALRLNYCNALCMGLPLKSTWRLQFLQNITAEIIRSLVEHIYYSHSALTPLAVHHLLMISSRYWLLHIKPFLALVFHICRTFSLCFVYLSRAFCRYCSSNKPNQQLLVHNTILCCAPHLMEWSAGYVKKLLFTFFSLCSLAFLTLSPFSSVFSPLLFYLHNNAAM